MSRKSSQIYSIFHECEAAAAEHLIKEGVANRIEANMIPPMERFNHLGQKALFAVVVPAAQIARFEKLCADLRA
jgi:hypothetical protein